MARPSTTSRLEDDHGSDCCQEVHHHLHVAAVQHLSQSVFQCPHRRAAAAQDLSAPQGVPMVIGIEKGKDADLIIFSGDPLDIRSKVEEVYINGKQVK